MNRLYKILGLGIAFVIALQSVQFTISTYFYTNHNDVLVAACCKNKITDPSCKAKCFLDDSEKQQKDTDATSIKKIEYINQEISLLEKEKKQRNFINVTEKVNYKYQNLYAFLFLESKVDPPIVG